MKTAVVSMESLSPYSQSKMLDMGKKEDKESHEDFERRIWRDRMHVNQEGHVFIPPMAFKKCIETAASFFSEKIPGKGNATFTKHFKAGILVTEGPDLGINPADVEGEWLSLDADGAKGSRTGKRVNRCMPCIREWNADVTFYILDDTITQEIFERYIKEAGNFIGIGRFRPENSGFYGRFQVSDIKWN